MSTCILVLGTPRSGTSCVAGICHKLGIVMGKELISEDGKPRFDWPDVDKWNATGYFQDAPLENLQSAIFNDGFGGWPIAKLKPEHEAELAAIIAERESLGVDWGSKTSRMAYILPHFLRLCNSDVRLIVTSRRRSESLASWQMMLGHNAAKTRTIIDRAKSAVVSAKNLGVPILEVEFDELLTSPDIVDRIAHFVGRKVTDEAKAHVDSSLRRFNHSDVKAG